MITAIPPNTSGADLIATLNDRIRQINTAIGGSATETGGPSGVSYGTHAVRVGRPIPADGEWFAETDRGLIYQVQARVWKYVAGIMRGTLAQRPTGLGPGDAGLFYTATDDLDYYWSGTAWVAGDAGRTLKSANVDVTGVYKVAGVQVVGGRLAAIPAPTINTTTISDTADATYSANEVTMLGNLKAAVNQLNVDVVNLETTANNLRIAISAAGHGLTG